jgi:small subunit ribosomal protein S17
MADEHDKETPENADGAPAEPDAAGEQPVEAEGGAAVKPDETSEAPADAQETTAAEQAPEPEAEQAEPTAEQAAEPAAEQASEPAAEQALEAKAEQAAEAEAEPAAEAEGEAPEAVTPAAAARAGEPAKQASPKERRRKARSRHSGAPGPARSLEERHADRLLERRAKAVRRRVRRLKERAKAAERRAKAPAREPLAPVHAPVEGTRRVRQGIVVSDKAEKTITVRIDVARRHRRYEKIVRSSSTLHAHDENNDAHEGDVVRVIESRPLSRSKRWKLVDVVERAR